MRTKIVASAPSPAITIPTGTFGGSSTPVARRTRKPMTARPVRKTSFPRMPVCQARTEYPIPSIVVEYQPMKAESVKTIAESHATSSPGVQKDGVGPVPRERGSVYTALEAEEGLDLVPDRQP